MANRRKQTVAVALTIAVVAAGAALTSMYIRHAEAPLRGEAVRADSLGTASMPSDEQIVSAIQRENLQLTNLSVRSFNGIVILRGNGDRAAAERAVGAIKNLGATRVANLIQPAAKINDEAIRVEAERQLAYLGSLEGCTVVVTCENGIVRVSGTVQTELQKDMARSILRGVRGAKEVRVELSTTQA